MFVHVITIIIAIIVFTKITIRLAAIATRMEAIPNHPYAY